MSEQVSIKSIPSDITKAIKLIKKFLRINKLKIPFKINIDYSIDSYGTFNPNKKYEFNINPDKFHNYAPSEIIHSDGFTYDRTLHGVCIHEFCHLLDEHLGLEQMYRNEFKEKLILNDYCKEMWCEEMAEVMMLYMTNPFLLKHIDGDRFDFFNSIFKSPTKLTDTVFKSKYKKWSKDIQKVCKDVWGIWIYKNQIYMD